MRAEPQEVADGAWIALPGGTFLMGDDDGRPEERPAHQVTVAAFAIQGTEVTNAAFLLFRPDYEPHPLSKCERCPAVLVNAADAEAYCASLGGRLPTEAEWEFAARGGLSGKDFPWGDEAPTNGVACRGRRKTEGACPVASFPPNPYGLFDMAGNVWEWTSDRFDIGTYSRASGEPAPPPPPSGATRVIRGGAYIYRSGDNLRCARRGRVPPDDRNGILGFRCVRTPGD